MATNLTTVIARSASDEAIHSSACETMDCFAALAMTNSTDTN
ncbi:hypothetical protein ACVIGA_002121 [Bradyrhizobium sp. USDA 3240]